MNAPNLVLLEGVKITFRNFSGLPGKFNEQGNRNFAVVLDEDIAADMAKNGWNVRQLEPRGDEEKGDQVLKVRVAYWRRDGSPTRPPRVVLISSKGKTPLTEKEISILDWAELEKVDLTFRPYEYEPGKYSAYLNSIYATIVDDPLELKYWDVEDSTANSIMTEPVEEDPLPL